MFWTEDSSVTGGDRLASSEVVTALVAARIGGAAGASNWERFARAARAGELALVAVGAGTGSRRVGGWFAGRVSPGIVNSRMLSWARG